jgi:uncharacterized membrane protein
MMRRVGILLAALGVSSANLADGPAGKLRVVSPKGVDIVAAGINGRGEVVGFEWAEEVERPGVVAQRPFFARGKEMTYLPLLKGYTATFPAAVSDEGTVVGRASKPAPRDGPRVFMRNQAFVWDAKAGIRGLGVLEGDMASFACGVSRDGRRVSGYSVGDNRLRACVWEREGDGDRWKGTALPHESRLGSNTVAISGDGRLVAALDGAVPCLWTLDRNAPGRWTRETIADPGAIIPRAVNDSGTVAGLFYTPDGQTHAAVWTRAGGCTPLKEPAGYVSSEATAVNNPGVVVGMVDGPHGSDVGPNAFAYENGRLRLIDEGGPLFSSATAINDQGQVAGVLEDKEEEAPATAKPAAGKTRK